VADLIIIGTLLSMDPQRTIWSDGAVVINQGEITAVGTRSELLAQHPDTPTLGGPDCLITPGFINAHQHLTGDRLIRSCIPDTLVSSEAIFDWVVPTHAAHTPDDDELSATLSLLEAVGNGITTTVEAGTVAHPYRVAAAFEKVGVRGCIGSWGWDVEDGPFAAPANDVLARQRQVVEDLVDHPLVDGWVTLVGHDLATDYLYAGAANLARELHTNLTFHLSPSAQDGQSFALRSGKRPVTHLNDLNVLGPHLLMAHAVHLDNTELDLLLSTDTSVAYCPWAYLRLGQGVTQAGRHVDFLDRGGRLALGIDSENAGDAIDPLRVASLAAGLAKDMSQDTTAFSAHQALELLTIGGATAIGQAGRIGSLEVGKKADIVVHGLSGTEASPAAIDPVLQLIWASDGRGVRHVIVDGKIVVQDGQSTQVNHQELRSVAQEARQRLLSDAGLNPTPLWPVR
jgi:5-methylthioadenosine/S-adenosylhomocysteine deaminase